MDFDLHYLIRLARRWWWLPLLAPLLAGGTAFYTSDQQTPLYSATVTLRVNPPAGSTADYSALQLTQNLTETYRQMIVMSPVLDRAIALLGLPYDDDELGEKTTAAAVQDTQLLKLSVSDPDPDNAALIANTIGNEFIAYLSEQTTDQFSGSQELLNGQLASVQEQLGSVRQQLEALDLDENADNTAIQGQIDALELQETQLLQQQASLQMQIQALSVGLVSSQAQVTVTEPATEPEAPYAPRTLFYTALAAFVGLVIAVMAIALLEYLDNTIRADTDITTLTGAPLLTSISSIPKLKPGGHQVYTVTQPRSGPAEAVRLLRASLEFAAAAQPINSLAITSAGPGEGKSTVVANLGVVMAQAGFVTVIVDADLRKPTQHKIFNITNGAGLTNLLTHPGLSWRDVANRVAVPNLNLITSGPIPPNPADLLSLDRFTALLETLESEADIVLVDTPPVLAVSDPLLVASKADGIILLGRANYTRRDRLRDAAQALERAGVRTVGVVVNQQTETGGGYYYYYGEYGNSSTGTMDQPVFAGGAKGHLSDGERSGD